MVVVVVCCGTKINASHLSEWSGAVRATVQSDIPSYSASGPVSGLECGDWGQSLLSVVALEIMNKIMRIICYCQPCLSQPPPCLPVNTSDQHNCLIKYYKHTLSLSEFQYNLHQSPSSCWHFKLCQCSPGWGCCCGLGREDECDVLWCLVMVSLNINISVSRLA